MSTRKERYERSRRFGGVTIDEAEGAQRGSGGREASSASPPPSRGSAGHEPGGDGREWHRGRQRARRARSPTRVRGELLL